MINVTNNTIVPIARSDEHHTGYDVLSELVSESTSHFISLFNGNNYFYGDDKDKYLIAVTNWLNYGGPNLSIKNVTEKNRPILTFKAFIESSGDFTIVKGKLAPLGSELYRLFAALSSEFRPLENKEAQTITKSQVDKVFKRASTLLRFISLNLLNIEVDYDMVKSAMIELDARWSNSDVKWVEQVFFGMPSIKNSIHMGMRQAINPKSGYHGDAIAVWGDLDLAIKMLGGL